jgi:uncharacterized protein (DUF433 family)
MSVVALISDAPSPSGESMPKLEYRNIEKVQNRCGGRAVIAGTRIRVSLIVQFERQGMTPTQIVAEYPHLRVADIYDALAYAADHPDEIETDIADDDEQAAMRDLGVDRPQR